MTITELETVLRTNIEIAIASGWKLQPGFGNSENLTCCAISANGWAEAGHVNSKQKEVGLPSGSLWEVACGFDDNRNPFPHSPYFALGQKLRQTYAPQS